MSIMQSQPVAKNPVLIQLPTGLYLGLVCYNPLYENLQFVLEKRDFFEMEWPALMISQERGLFPVLLGLPHITIQRAQILWYTTYIPAELLQQYQSFLPLMGGEAVPAPKPSQEMEGTKVPTSKRKSKGDDKVIPLHARKGSTHDK